MGRMIFCTFLKKNAQGLDVQIYPGALGKRIYEEISKEAWSAWLVKQTMLINEKKLNMMNVADRQFLEQAMVDFLFKNKEIHIEGYVQPER